MNAQKAQLISMNRIIETHYHLLDHTRNCTSNTAWLWDGAGSNRRALGGLVWVPSDGLPVA